MAVPPYPLIHHFQNYFRFPPAREAEGGLYTYALESTSHYNESIALVPCVVVSPPMKVYEECWKALLLLQHLNQSMSV